VPKYDDAEGPLAVETKKSIRNRGESSPDIADALIFTFYGSDRIAIAKEKKVELDYYRKLRSKERKKTPRSWVGV